MSGSMSGGTEHNTPRFASASAAGAASCMQPVQYRGSQLLQFVPEQQYKVLQSSSQLAGVHKHLGLTYGVALAAVDAIAADGKAALVVGPLALAERLKQDLPDTQVGLGVRCEGRFCHNAWEAASKSTRISVQRRPDIHAKFALALQSC
jgi:hypothetical protein